MKNRKVGRPLIDITGCIYGKLLVLERAPDHIQPNGEAKICWKCQCECGNIENYVGSKLRRGSFRECSICRKSSGRSKGEQKVFDLLTKSNIKFIEQCPILIDEKTKSRLYIDFFVDNKYIIEYDGKQHFESVKYFGGIEKFKRQQFLDNLKNEYCKEHNLKIIRIPYTHYNNLELKDLLIESSSFVL